MPQSASNPVTLAVIEPPHEPATLPRLLERLPPGVRPVVAGPVNGIAAVESLPTAARGLGLLAEAAARYPGSHLVLVTAGARLPPLGCERLLRALAEPEVVGALALDAGARSPLVHPPHPGQDAEQLDALCFAGSQRMLLPDADFPRSLPGLSAWHGPRLAQLGLDALEAPDRIAAAGLRVVLLDHVYAAGGEAPLAAAADPRDPPPPSPLAPLRDWLAEAGPDAPAPPCAGLDRRPVVLHVLHGWGGGAERWVRDMATADPSAHHLVLIARGSHRRAAPGEWLELHAGTLQGPPLRRMPLPRPIMDTAVHDAGWQAVFTRLLHEWSVDAVVVSSLIGHSLDAFRSGLPTWWVIHDHYPLWPVLHRDFGDPGSAFDDGALAGDLARGPRLFSNADPEHWRRLRTATLAAALEARVGLLAPSRSALANHLRLAPALDGRVAHVIPHGLAPWPGETPSIPPPPSRRRLRALIIGRLSRGKGADLLAAALPVLREHAELFLLGAGTAAEDFYGEAGVHILLDYQRDDLPRHLAALQPDVALLLPTVSETFSYTLSELQSLHVPVIATRVGALAERIEDGTTGWLVPPDATALVERVQQLASDRAPLHAVRQALASRPVLSSATSAAEVMRRLDLPVRPPLRYPLAGLDTGTLSAAAAADRLRREAEASRHLASELVTARSEAARRGEWGHAREREVRRVGLLLQSEQQRLNTEITRLGTLVQREQENAQQAITRLSATQGELVAAHNRLAELEDERRQILASRSWRLTRPLRVLARLQRRLRTGVAFRGGRLRAGFARVRGSLARRGLAGTWHRLRQELRPATAPALGSWATPSGSVAVASMPAVAAPQVSIVIPVFNKLEYTLACLASLVEHAGAVPFEVIVVDDGSSDGSAARLGQIENLQLVQNARNLGFVGSCNAGAAVARGELLLFLNNDTLATAGWLEALVDCLRTAPEAGLVGARLVYPDGRLQEAGGIVFSDGSGWNTGRFEDPSDPRYAFRREVDYCSGAAILLPRGLFERIGGFDDRYAPAYYEDTDLAFAVREAGLRVYVEPAATVVHFEGVTSGTDTGSGTKRYQVINQEKFRQKWHQALARQPEPGTPITLAATHRARHRVLIIDATTPQPDHDSGSLRMVNLMRVLGDLGAQVSFMPENRLFDPVYTPPLQALGIEALYAPYAQDPVKLLQQRGREFDLVILSRHYVASAFLGLVRLYAPQARVAFDTVDLHYLREQREAELSGNAELARVAAATRARELKLIRDTDVTLVVSPVEQALLAREAPGARVEVLSNVHEVHGCRQGFGGRRDLVFVGGFQHPPNTDAVLWFAGEVLPIVRSELPEVRFHVIGSKVPDAVRALAGCAVEVHGFVPDLDPWMDGCRISVAPLRYGAGVKGKVNMAMSCGLPVVSTSVGIEGMHVEDGREVLVADTAEAFAAAIVRLYRDEPLWNRLSAAGLANVERHFSFAAARRQVATLLAAGSTQ